MRKLDPPKTPLLEVLRQCTVEEQHRLAELAGTKRNYLYQLATCKRNASKLDTAFALVRAVNDLHVTSLGRVPKISLEELATMCRDCGV